MQEHARNPFDIIHAQYGYPCGWAALLASQQVGVPNVVSIQGGDGHWVGSCCETHRLAMTRVLDHANAVLIDLNARVERIWAYELGQPAFGTPNVTSDAWLLTGGAMYRF